MSYMDSSTIQPKKNHSSKAREDLPKASPSAFGSSVDLNVGFWSRNL